MRNQVIEGRENFAKDSIKFYYKLAKKIGLTEKLLECSGLKSEDSLRWSYNKGRISIEQIRAYETVLHANKQFLTGELELTDYLRKKEIDRINIFLSTQQNEFDTIEQIIESPNTSRITNYYKEKILKCLTTDERNIIKNSIIKFRSDLNFNLDNLEKLIDTLNNIE
ncbi:hypothetical protein ACQPVA_02905 [Clostridium butyricum]|uniref:hypothetical protein n=1 Tax=Clostridium butyricum TaxID=1492 RepID=UPI003D32BD5D